MRRAIARGRLQRSLVTVDGRTYIGDPVLADREWAANTDHSRSPDAVKAREAARKPGVSGKDPGVSGKLLEFPSIDPNASALAGAAAQEKLYRAKLAELTFRERAGELVEKAPLQAALTETFTRCRTAILGIPSKFKQRLPELPHEHLVLLDGLLRETLESLAAPEGLAC